MLRRRLVLSSSSDEDDEPHSHPQLQHHRQESQPQPQPPLIPSHSRDSVNPNANLTAPNPSSAEPLEISDDDDFIDVSDSLSPPSPPNPNPNPNTNRNLNPPPPPRPPSTGGCPISEFLWRLGLGLKREWLSSCVRGLEQAVPGFGSLGDDAKAKLCFEKFLVSDMNRSGGGVLPDNVDRLHLVDLSGPFVLQVDEIVNISNPLKGRYQKAPPGIKRCLKLSMTDGLQRVFGMEYRPIKELDALAPAGLKVVICNVHIRRGLLMLVPEAFEVLGGVVEELEAARQRLIDEVNKPPRGIRTRGGEVPPLRTRATLAAWPSNAAHAAGNANNMTSEETTPFRVHNQGATYVAQGTNAGQRIEGVFHGDVSEENAIHNRSTNVLMDVEELPIRFATQLSNGAHAAGNANNMTFKHTTPFQVLNQGASYVAHGADAGQRIEEEFPGAVSEESATRNPSTNVVMDVEELPIPASAENAIPNLSPQVVTGAEEAPYVVMSTEVEEVHVDTILNSRENIVPNSLSDTASIMEEIDMDMISSRMENRVEEIDADMISLRTENPVSDTYPDDVLNDEEIRPADEVEHPLILSGNREIPFTYLASLSAKWTAMKKNTSSVKGMIKCFLTGVKRFQYSTNYELRVYVDDGSLISEIFIHHDVVQKLVGHSPQEVKVALSSPESTMARNIRETMKQFQSFLSNFEGKMLIEISEASPLPVALEMNEGCSESDAQLLLQRLKSSVSAQT